MPYSDLWSVLARRSSNERLDVSKNIIGQKFANLSWP